MTLSIHKQLQFFTTIVHTLSVGHMEECIFPFSRVPCSLRQGLRGFTGKQKWQTKKSFSPLGSDDVCYWRDDCMPDVCLQQLRADGKAICVQPPICQPPENFKRTRRKRPVGCQIQSMLLFAEFHYFCALIGGE